MATGIVATYTATELNKTGGKILDDARSGTVRIKRRGVSYVLMREEHLAGLLQAARDGRPEFAGGFVARLRLRKNQGCHA